MIMFKKNDGKINIFMMMGLLLVAAALLLVGYNLYDEKRAGDAAVGALSELEKKQVQAPDVELPTNSLGEYNLDLIDDETEVPDYILNPDMDMPLASIEGQDYIGTISFPNLYKKLPVISSWDYDKMKLAPCVYSGTPYKDNLILIAHNYETHFGDLDNLSLDDELSLTDMDGNVFNYSVVEKEILEPDAIEQLASGDWDLTLITCTISGQTRLAVRCERK